MANTSNVILPKPSSIKKARISDPAYSSTDPGNTLVDQQDNFLNRSGRDIRTLDKKIAIRALARVNGMVSAAIQSYVNLAMSTYKVTAYDSATQLFDLKGTVLAGALVNRLDILNDYSQGYMDKRPLSQLLETMLMEVVLTGGCGGELVLDKFRLPDRIVPISNDTIEWKVKKDKRKFPVQNSTAGGDPISLDFPSIFFEFLNMDANTVYPHSMLESALNVVFMFLDFLEDMSRVLRRSGHTRLSASIKIAEAVQSAPAAVQADPAKMTKYLVDLQQAVTESLAGLEPNEAVVSFDNVEFEMLSSQGEKADYTQLLEALNGLVASSLKSMPSALGLRIGKGSQSLSNTETLLYLKSVEALRKPVESLMSRALTMGARLTGEDVYVKFKFDPVELRPETELEAHYLMRQSRILDQLSLGFISDDEAAHSVGAGFRQPGAPDLSGTMFRQPTNIDASKATPNNGAQEKALTSDSPTNQNGAPPED